MKIEVAKKNQSLDVLQINNTDEVFEPIISKSKRKQEKRK
jgi:hypothetical protein